MAITGIVLHGLRVRPHDRQPEDVPRAATEFDHYGEFLRELLVPILPRTVSLWLLRIGLIAAFALHIHAAYSLTVMNRRARPMKYQSQARLRRRQLRQPHDALDRHHRPAVPRLPPRRPDLGLAPTPTSSAATPTTTSTRSLSRVPVAILYIVANIALGIHLFHGAWSLFQSLGLEQPPLQQRGGVASPPASPR